MLPGLKIRLFIIYYLCMKILVCAATWKEMKIIKNNIKNLNIPHLSVVFLTTGIWNYETLFSLSQYMLTNKEEKPDLLLNIWVCWYIWEKKKLVQITRIINASTGKENIVPIIKLVAPVSSCFCSETPVYSDLLEEETYIVDMESFAIDYVGQKFQIPRIILKVPIDKIGEETKHFNHENALTLLENNIDWKTILLDIIW